MTAHTMDTLRFRGAFKLRILFSDLALNMISKGMFARLLASSGLLVTTVIRETRSRVALWFCFKRTSGAPSNSKVRVPLEPASLKWIGFSSIPQKRSDKSFPMSASAKARTRTVFNHMARSRFCITSKLAL